MKTIKELTIEYLLNSNIGDELKRSLDTISNIQEAISLMRNRHEDNIFIIKAGTTLMLALITKKLEGISPVNYSKDDWEDIINAVSQYAVHMEGQQYSLFVFCLSENYIRYSLSIMEELIPESSYTEIRDLADSLHSLQDQFSCEIITEADYIEQSLWISFEAVLKLLSSYIGMFGSSKSGELVNAVTSLAFEYGRYHLLQKENALLSAYLSEQHNIDEQLESEFQNYIAELQFESDQFNALVQNAFDPDFGDKLHNSINLARAVGVPEIELLDSDEKINAFFMD